MEGYESLIETLDLPEADDCHVLAAAIAARASVIVIVTNNVRDFPALALAPHGLRAQKPDALLRELWPDNSAEIIVALSRQRARLRNPPQSPAEFLGSLKRQGLTQFADTLTPFQGQLQPNSQPTIMPPVCVGETRGLSPSHSIGSTHNWRLVRSAFHA